MKKRILLFSMITGSVQLVQAQVPDGAMTDSIVTPQFFIAVLAGVILALGFQFILTALSVAMGISAVGDLKKTYVHNKVHDHGKDQFTDTVSNEDDSFSAGKMVSAGLGIWSIITVSLSLFGATALAINLSLITNTIISITLALVIWALFFILLFYLETKIVNTVVGGLINTATAGLRSSGQAIKKMFATSEEEKIQNIADETVDKITQDLRASFDPDILQDTLDEFFTRFEQTTPDYERLKNDIAEIVEKSSTDQTIDIDQSQENTSKNNQGKWMAAQSVLNKAISEASNTSENQSKKEQLKNLKDELATAYNDGDTQAEKIGKTVAHVTPAEEKQIRSYIQKLEQLLQDANPQNLQTDTIEKQVNEILKNPQVSTEKLSQKIKELDKDHIINILANNSSLTKDQINDYAVKFEKALMAAKSKLNVKSSEASDQFDRIKSQIKDLVDNYLNGKTASDIDMKRLEGMFKTKLNDHKENVNTLKQRLRNLDKEQVTDLVSNNTYVDQKNTDKVTQSIESARNQLLKKIEELEQGAKGKMAKLKRKAVLQAEHTRKIAAIAAWWVVLSAVLSAGAAIGGSLLAM